MATQNPIELEGVPIAGSSAGRFLMKVTLGYRMKPTRTRCCYDSKGLTLWIRWKRRHWDVGHPADAGSIRTVRVEGPFDSISSTSAARRDCMTILCWAPAPRYSPIPNVSGARRLNGRDFIIPDDVKQMAPHVLTHRLVVNPQTRLRAECRDVVKEVVDTVAVPVDVAWA